MPLKLPNPHIEKMDEDVLYHLALGTKSHDLKAMFGDIKVTIGIQFLKNHLKKTPMK